MTWSELKRLGDKELEDTALIGRLTNETYKADTINCRYNRSENYYEIDCYEEEPKKNPYMHRCLD